jgi:dipeptidyl aminopeptidase/acylaminoacyl peptidase
LRARDFSSAAEIEIVQVLEEAQNFTRYLIAYPSDGLRVTGMLNRSRGDKPFRVIILAPVTPDQAPDLYQRLSPLPYLDLVQAPVQIHWGSNDEVVPCKWSGDLLAELQATGKQIEYFEYPGQPHSFQGASNQLYLRRIAEFYQQYLGT